MSRFIEAEAKDASWINAHVLVHVGLHKTATSWLQEYYLSRDNYGYWIPPLANNIRTPIKAAGELLLWSAQRRLIAEDDFDPEPIRIQLMSFRKPAGFMPVISNERLAGHPLSGGFDRKILALRIKSIFPQARILITIREQKSLIMSNYVQYLKNGGWHSPEWYLEPESDGRQPVCSLRFWDYERLIALYDEIFGAQNVFALPYEILRKAPLEFVSHIARFAQVAPPGEISTARTIVNARRPHVPSYYLRYLTALQRRSSANAFIPFLRGGKWGKYLVRGIKKACNTLTPSTLERNVELALANRIDKKIGGYFSESNLQAARRCGFDLNVLGYDVSS
jgi:hypothetical protein